MVSDVPDQLPRSRAHAAGPRRGGGSHHHLPVDPSLCGRTLEAASPPPAHEQPWRVDETYVKVKGRWIYLYRAVDSRGQPIDFLLSANRDAEAAKRFFCKALAQPHTVNPRTITVDKNAAYPKATAEMKKDGELWRRSRLRQVKYLNNIVEQDHRNVKRLTRPGLGFGSFWTARRTLAGYEAMAMMRKGQVRNISGNDIRAQATFIAGLFQVAA
jgi:IS6 family transposase